MIETKKIIVEGIELVIPVALFDDWPTGPLDSIKDCCGPGHGAGDLLVPESIFGIRITPACFIHDYCWELAPATWGDFHQSNSIFLHNLLAILRVGSKNSVLLAIRNYRAVTYYNAVDFVGAKIFWRLKRRQGLLPDG